MSRGVGERSSGEAGNSLSHMHESVREHHSLVLGTFSCYKDMDAQTAAKRKKLGHKIVLHPHHMTESHVCTSSLWKIRASGYIISSFELIYL